MKEQLQHSSVQYDGIQYPLPSREELELALTIILPYYKEVTENLKHISFPSFIKDAGYKIFLHPVDRRSMQQAAAEKIIQI